MKARLAAIQEEIDAVNRDRKISQEALAPRLAMLARKWTEVTQKNAQIEIVSALMEAEISKLTSSGASADAMEA